MHEKGGMELALAMSKSYSTKQLYDVLEMLDVHDAMSKMIKDQNKKQTQG